MEKILKAIGLSFIGLILLALVSVFIMTQIQTPEEFAQSKIESQKKDFRKSLEEKNMMGIWEYYVGEYYMGRISLYQQGGLYKIDLVYADKSSSTNELVKEDDKFFKKGNPAGEYFTIEANGNLGLYDNEGKFAEAYKD